MAALNVYDIRVNSLVGFIPPEKYGLFNYTGIQYAVIQHFSKTVKGMRVPIEYHLAVQRRGVLSLPADLRKRRHLDEPGAQVHLIERDDGVIELHPQLPVSADQAWFWTERWQQMEREADADIAEGRTERFDDIDEFLADLDVTDQ